MPRWCRNDHPLPWSPPGSHPRPLWCLGAGAGTFWNRQSKYWSPWKRKIIIPGWPLSWPFLDSSENVLSPCFPKKLLSTLDFPPSLPSAPSLNYSFTLSHTPFGVLCLLASWARKKDNHERGTLEWTRAVYLLLTCHTASISDNTGISFLFHQPWLDRQFKVMIKVMDFQVRHTSVSGGSGIYKLYALEQASLPHYSLVSPSEKWNNSDTYLTGLLRDLDEILHAKGLTIPCIYSKLSVNISYCYYWQL